MKRKILVLLALLLLFTPKVLAQADDLVIDLSSEQVSLILTESSMVLAASTDKKEASKKEVPKSVQLMAPNSHSTVKIDPKPTSNKKVNVTITPQTGKVVKESVDTVVAQGAAGQTVFKVKPKEDNIVLEQGTAQVSTNLPLQVDTQSHKLSAVVGDKPVGLSLLPTEALVAAGVAKPSVSLVSSRQQLLYEVSGQKSLDIFGVWNLTLPVKVDVSAQTGAVSRVDQPLLFTLLGR